MIIRGPRSVEAATDRVRGLFAVLVDVRDSVDRLRAP